MDIEIMTEPEEWGEKGTARVRNAVFGKDSNVNGDLELDNEMRDLANEGLADYARMLREEDEGVRRF